MELDSRILEGKKPLTALDTDVAKEFIGKQCYFADNIEDFFNLDNTNVLKGVLTDIDDNEMISGCFKSNGIRSSFFGHFIVPCEWVETHILQNEDKINFLHQKINSMQEELNQLKSSVNIINDRLNGKIENCCVNPIDCRQQ